MPELQWSEALDLSMPVMDATHREFVDLLAVAADATDAGLMPAWKALMAHTQDHFDREDQWMKATGFAAGNCHSTQHAVVLKVLREGTIRGEQGDLAPIRQLTHELALWFPHHAQTMDAGLALHLKSMGLDPHTGELAASSPRPTQAITGCGSGGCQPAVDVSPAAA